MENREDNINIINMDSSETKKTSREALTHSLLMKTVAMILAILMSFVVVLSVFGATLMIVLDMYSTPKAVMLSDSFDALARDDCNKILPDLISAYAVGDTNEIKNQQEYVRQYLGDGSVVYASFTDADTGELLCEYESEGNVKYQSPKELEFVWHNDYYSIQYTENGVYEEIETLSSVNVTMVVSTEYSIPDKYYVVENLLDIAYSLLYSIYVIGVGAGIILILCVVFLMCSSGHRKGRDGIQGSWATKIPLDLLTLIVAGIVIGSIMIMWLMLEEASYYDNVFAALMPLMVTGVVVIGGLAELSVLGYLMSLATRVKLGKCWRNTLIFYIVRLIYRAIRCVVRFLRNLPIVWKTAVSVAVVTIIELIVIVNNWWEMDNLTVFWFIEKLVLVPLVINCALTMKKLKKAGDSLAEGDLSYQVETSRMWGDFKHHGKALNNIAEGMTLAVGERMKSERMKTELITNVSHDIKTPLTSIINYTDLISKEKCDNPKITEYTQVLIRSSERLKRLIEDLVEASKASTGNIEINPEPCNMKILLTQAVGEYEDKLKNAKLELVTSMPEEDTVIMADGRRLWRVLDNLINNVCKYSQDYTRVYLSLETEGDEVVLTLKNTSRTALNISADELMERFVRGDSSRSTEGNGLGLSIARSLTELQGGTMNLVIDGDLFKVILRFSKVK